MLVKIYVSLSNALYGFHSFLPSHLQVTYPVVQNQASTTALLTKEHAPVAYLSCESPTFFYISTTMHKIQSL
jgi:hypothetical protein